jgi:uncharacterized protein DUF4352
MFAGVTVIALLFAGCSAMIAASSKSHLSDGDRFRGPTGVQGSRLHDGDFEFMVSEVSTPTSWRAEPRPRGVWVIATTTVHNLDDEAQEFAANNQRLIASDGHSYLADTRAAVAMNDSSMVITMAPGANITMKLPFDVPEGTLPTAIELHDSVFSDGARVRVDTANAPSLP